MGCRRRGMPQTLVHSLNLPQGCPVLLWGSKSTFCILYIYIWVFSPWRTQESSLSPSLPLSQRLFCISHTSKIFLIVEKETCGFSLISYDNSGSGERFSLCPRFGIWFAESGLNPRSSDLETHTIFTRLQMLLEIQNLKGYLLPYSILPQTPYTKSGISKSVINMKVNLRDVNCSAIQWLLPEQGRGSELCLWFFISWDFKSVSCPFYLPNLLFPLNCSLKVLIPASQFLHRTFNLLMNCEVMLRHLPLL